MNLVFEARERPADRVVGSITPAEVEGTMSDLGAAGFDDILILTADDLPQIDLPIDQAGFQGFLTRLVLSLGADLAFLERTREELINGNSVLLVAVEDDAQKRRVAEILQRHGSDAPVFMGQWTYELL